MVLPKKSIRTFQEKILSWYGENRRDLSWRKTRDPYKILLSEVMLQQTQVARVIPKYELWLKKFPTLEALASASRRDVLSMWSGLGYNRRALNLREVAKMIVEEYQRVFPQSIEELKKLPGIGEYTARAVACFAFNEQVAVVDTNVRKVILLEIIKVPEKPRGTKEIQEIADTLLPYGRARDWNYALMDYASSELKNEKIPIPKQSRFKDSSRYYRGKLLRLLLAEKTVSLKNLGEKLKDDFAKKDEEWLKTILSQMEKEGFIRYDGKIVSLLSET